MDATPEIVESEVINRHFIQDPLEIGVPVKRVHPNKKRIAGGEVTRCSSRIECLDKRAVDIHLAARRIGARDAYNDAMPGVVS